MNDGILFAGTRVGEYRIVVLLGHGRFANVGRDYEDLFNAYKGGTFTENLNDQSPKYVVEQISAMVAKQARRRRPS